MKKIYSTPQICTRVVLPDGSVLVASTEDFTITEEEEWI